MKLLHVSFRSIQIEMAVYFESVDYVNKRFILIDRHIIASNLLLSNCILLISVNLTLFMVTFIKCKH